MVVIAIFFKFFVPIFLKVLFIITALAIKSLYTEIKLILLLDAVMLVEVAMCLGSSAVRKS